MCESGTYITRIHRDAPSLLGRRIGARGARSAGRGRAHRVTLLAGALLLLLARRRRPRGRALVEERTRVEPSRTAKIMLKRSQARSCGLVAVVIGLPVVLDGVGEDATHVRRKGHHVLLAVVPGDQPVAHGRVVARLVDDLEIIWDEVDGDGIGEPVGVGTELHQIQHRTAPLHRSPLLQPALCVCSPLLL